MRRLGKQLEQGGWSSKAGWNSLTKMWVLLGSSQLEKFIIIDHLKIGKAISDFLKCIKQEVYLKLLVLGIPGRNPDMSGCLRKSSTPPVILNRMCPGRKGNRGVAAGKEWADKKTKSSSLSLVGGLEHFLFSHILGIIIPID